MKKLKVNNQFDQFDENDDAFDNVSSFEEARAIINARLNHLCSDLSYHSDTEDALFNEIIKAYEDRKISLMDLYAGYYAPCKVSEPTFVPNGQGDMNDVMISFSEGFNEFINSMEKQYINFMIGRRRAAILLNKILSIDLPYSRLIYLYYYKRRDPIEISESLFISRATFYRLKSLGIDELTKLYFPNDDKDKDKDESGNGKEAG